MRVGAWLRVPRHVVTAGAVVLAVLYTAAYLADPALPGNGLQSPDGWWGWFDQSKTLESARAFAAWDFAPDRHWYPLAYSMLGALFWQRGQAHPFFFVDLVLLLTAYGGFVAFACRTGIAAAGAVPLFLFAVAADHRLLTEWVIPWNTTASASLIWLLLAVTAAHMAGPHMTAARTKGTRRPFVLGLVAAAIPLVRPTEAILALPCVAAAVATDLWLRRLRWMDALRFGAGAAVVVVPYTLIHLRIYGPHPSGYMMVSRDIGFTWHDLGWKAYVVLIEPRAWFMDGEGLLRRVPWLALGLAGLAPALARDRISALLAAVLLIHGVLYLSYVDLLPTGFWRYHNVHYWSWAFPGFGLAGLLLVRDLVRPRTRRDRPVAAVLALVCGLLLCVHVDPRPARDGEATKMVELPGVPPPFGEANFGAWTLRDGVGELRNVNQIRGVPVPTGLRVLALRRALWGPVSFVTAPDGWQAAGTPKRYAAGIAVGRPCWILRKLCPAPPVSNLLPSPPP